MTLQELFEQNKERLMQIAAGQDSGRMITDLQSELDRMLYTYNDAEESARVREAANAIMQTVKASAGLLDTDGEPRIYSRTEYGTREEKRRLPFWFWLFLCAGIVCTGVFVYLILRIAGDIPALTPAGQAGGLPAWCWYLIMPAAAMIFYFLAGFLMRGRQPKESAQLYAEVPADPQKVYTRMLAAVLTADKCLEDIRSAEALQERQKAHEEIRDVDPAELDLLSSMLEDAYSRRDTDEQAAEVISQIKYYLHTRHIDVVDWQAAKAAEEGGPRREWFDMLPAARADTYRPALAADGRLLMKGLASEGSN